MFENNAFDIPGSSSGVPGAGIFLQGTRINHSCLPNVSHSWNKQLNAKVFHALRDLEKGEELTTSYILPFQAREARQRYLLEKHGFVCQCVACGREAIFGERMKAGPTRYKICTCSGMRVGVEVEGGGRRRCFVSVCSSWWRRRDCAHDVWESCEYPVPDGTAEVLLTLNAGVRS